MVVMARVYLETSFLSACVSDREDAASQFRRRESRRWWAQQRVLHQLFVSPEVSRELSSEGFRRSDAALALVGEAALLPVSAESRGLARIFVRERVMPGPEETGDALHVAIAAMEGMDIMLSWNVRHLANRNKVAHLREVCRRVGLVPPEILTPDSFWFTEEGSDQ